MNLHVLYTLNSGMDTDDGVPPAYCDKNLWVNYLSIVEGDMFTTTFSEQDISHIGWCEVDEKDGIL